MLARVTLGGIVAVMLITGIAAVVKPGWVAIVDRWYKAGGTSSRPGEIELSDTYYLVVRIVGIGLIVAGLVYGAQIL